MHGYWLRAEYTAGGSYRVCAAPSYDAPTSYVAMDNDVAAARRISGAALDDTAALMTASRRHDQQLLSDINARLVRSTVIHSTRCCVVVYTLCLYTRQGC